MGKKSGEFCIHPDIFDIHPDKFYLVGMPKMPGKRIEVFVNDDLFEKIESLLRRSNEIGMWRKGRNFLLVQMLHLSIPGMEERLKKAKELGDFMNKLPDEIPPSEEEVAARSRPCGTISWGSDESDPEEHS